MSRIMSAEEIVSILKPSKAEQGQTRVHERFQWPGSNNEALLCKAVREGRSTVTFTDGRQFSIIHKDKGLVYIKLASGEFGPCGYFNIEAIERTLGEMI